jgi:DNA primase
MCYILYDQDDAGRLAADKAFELLTEFGIQSKIIHLPDNIDPDLYVLQYGQGALLKLLNEA